MSATGESLTISHNVLDVSSSLEVTKFSQMTIRCNELTRQELMANKDCIEKTETVAGRQDSQIIYG